MSFWGWAVLIWTCIGVVAYAYMLALALNWMGI